MVLVIGGDRFSEDQKRKTDTVARLGKDRNGTLVFVVGDYCEIGVASHEWK